MAAEYLEELPAMAGQETQNHSRFPRIGLFPVIDRSNPHYIGIGNPGDFRDIVSRLNLGAIPAKVFDDISSVAEVIHDVAEIPRMRKPKRVAKFVHAGQIDDAFAQQRVRSGVPGNFRT